MYEEDVLRELRKHKKGIWLRELARKSKVSPATVCNYFYGYTDRNGNFIKPSLKKYVKLKTLGNGSLTLAYPK